MKPNSLGARVLAIGVLVTLLALPFVQPLSRLNAVLSERERVQARLTALTDRLTVLAQAQLPDWDIAPHVVRADSTEALQADLEAQLRTAGRVAGLSVTEVRRPAPGSVGDAFGLVQVALAMRGDLLSVDLFLAQLEQAALPISVSEIALTAGGGQRPDEVVMLELTASVVVQAEGNS